MGKFRMTNPDDWTTLTYSESDTDTDTDRQEPMYCSDLEEEEPVAWYLRDPADDLFDDPPPPPPSKRQNPTTSLLNQELAKSAVLSFLSHHYLQDIFEAVPNDYTVFTSVVRAAAAMVYLSLNEDLLFALAPPSSHSSSSTRAQEVNHLWNKIVDKDCAVYFRLNWTSLFYSWFRLGNHGLPIEEVVSSIVRDCPYSSLTQSDVNDIFISYLQGLDSPSLFGILIEDPAFEELKKAVNSMELPPRLKVDGYTRLMMSLYRRMGYSIAYMEMLLAGAYKEIDTDPLYNLKDEDLVETREQLDLDIRYFLSMVELSLTIMSKNQLCRPVEPIKELTDSQSVWIHKSVLRVIEIAECRPSALGSRFIRRKHLLWAFCECGYGLPPTIRDIVELDALDEDHPPYHVYMMAVKLAKAEADEENEIRLDHFMFAVLHSNKDIVIQTQEFEQFSKDLTLDMEDRRKRNKVPYLGELDISPTFSLKDVKKMLNSSELRPVIDHFSSIMYY